ncbi:STM4011 family radical SAM protein [Bacteroides xylanisolvens]|uniref:STM4011 family radical SAM protein n=1 Tax=Bacteroides xylanisolvens TaxID=371601 RepID=UPI0039B3D476
MKNEGALLSIKRIYYRGKLNSCNYTCSYCPFGKKSHLTATTQDEQAWNRFITAIEEWKGGPLQLFIIPYGEALIHRYYRKGIIHLAALPQVAGISCQTNLSFSADEWLDEFPATPALISKIKIWASFHPEMTSVESFVRRLHTLYNAGIQVCAGAVGNPMAKNVLSDLRNALLPDIYLFINAMQGLKSPLSVEDIRFFTQLDNLFEYDLKNASAQWDICSGGRSSCFIDWKGDIFGCPRSQVKIGNLYQNQILDLLLPCRRKVCDCYIAFSNLTNHPLHRIMGAGAFWRIPDKPFITSVFFDVDGTLTDAQGRVSVSYAHALRYIAQFVPLYLATSLSMQQARRKLGKALFSLFEGGVFADGGLLVYGGQSRCMPVELLLDINEESAKITAHSYEGQVYKYSMLVYDKEERINILSRLKEKPYQVFYKPPLITVIHKDVDKRKGVLHICKALAFPLDQVLIVGNSLKDWEMMSVVSHSCAVMNAELLLKERARYTLNPDRLAAFFRFRE